MFPYFLLLSLCYCLFRAVSFFGFPVGCPGRWDHGGPCEVFCITHYAGVGVTQTVYYYNKHGMGAFLSGPSNWGNMTISELADSWSDSGPKKKGLGTELECFGILLQRMQGATGGPSEMGPLVNRPVFFGSGFFRGRVSSKTRPEMLGIGMRLPIR